MTDSTIPMAADEVLRVMDRAMTVAALCDPAVRSRQHPLSNNLESLAFNLRGQLPEARAAVAALVAEREALRADNERLQRDVMELTAVVKAYETEVKLLTHKIITCGVAARHSDAGLTRRGAYADKWDSPQAEDVRKLRDKSDSAESALADALGLLGECIEHIEKKQRIDQHNPYTARELYPELFGRVDAMLANKERT